MRDGTPTVEAAPGAPGAFPVLISRFYFLRRGSPPPTPFSLQAFVSCHLFILHTDPFLQELSSPASGLAVTSLPEPLSSEGCGFHETWWSRWVRLAVLSESGSPPHPQDGADVVLCLPKDTASLFLFYKLQAAGLGPGAPMWGRGAQRGA